MITENVPNGEWVTVESEFRLGFYRGRVSCGVKKTGSASLSAGAHMPWQYIIHMGDPQPDQVRTVVAEGGARTDMEARTLVRHIIETLHRSEVEEESDG